ncbi:MAG: pimelyl-ACP methyl ester esterase, partial [Legionellales bacterium]
TRLALDAPYRVRCLLNIASSPYFITDSDWPGVRNEVFLRFQNNLATDAPKALKDFVALQSNTSSEVFVSSHPPSLAGLELGLSVLQSWDLRAQLKELAMPTGFFFGRLDPITPIKTLITMQKSYPQLYYHQFSKSAHMPFLSQTDEFIRVLEGFIS